MNNRKIIKLGNKLMGMVLIVVMVMVMVAMITPLRHQLRVLIAYEREMRVTFYINSIHSACSSDRESEDHAQLTVS